MEVLAQIIPSVKSKFCFKHHIETNVKQSKAKKHMAHIPA